MKYYDQGGSSSVGSPEADVAGVGALSKVLTSANPAGTSMSAPQIADPEIQKAYDEMIQHKDEYAKALEERYSKPNWFNIAAGFLKPQLGGFAASLGSAGREYGQQVEAQRALVPTIARARAEVDAARLNQLQQAGAQKKMADVGSTGTTPAENVVQAGILSGEKAPNIVSSSAQASLIPVQVITGILNGTIDYAKAASSYGSANLDDQLMKRYGIIASGNQLLLPGGKTVNINNGSNNPEPHPSGSVAPASPAAPVSTASLNGPSEDPAHIRGVPDSLTRNPGLPAWEHNRDTKAKIYNDLNDSLGKTSNSGFQVAKAANEVLELSQHPALAGVFGSMEKGDISSFLKKVLFEGEPGAAVSKVNPFQGMREALERYYVAKGDPNAADSAMTQYNAFKNALANLKGQVITAFPNQTNERSAIESMMVPDTTNTQDSFGRAISVLGSKGLMQYELHQGLVNAGKRGNFDAQDWVQSPEYQSVLNNAAKREKILFNTPAGRSVNFLVDPATNYFRDYFGTAAKPSSLADQLRAAKLNRKPQ